MRFICTTRPARLVLTTLILLSLGLGAGLVPCRTSLAELQGPTAEDRHVALAVRAWLRQRHLSGRTLDDESSRRCMETFLKALDPLKLYFYQSDIDGFMKYRDQLDDQFNKNDISFAYNVYRTFLKRVDERVEMSQKILDQPHDFTVDESMVRDFDAATYPKDYDEAWERWRKRVKFDLLREVVDGTDEKEAIAKLHKRYESFRKSKHQTDDDELLELYVSAMTMGFDPHSSYMSAGTLENFNIQMRLELEGIGASLRSVDGYTEVYEIIPGGAADRDGRLKKGDRIISVGQDKEGSLVDIIDMKLNDVVKRIRGKRGTIVRLELNPVDNPKERVTYAIERDRIELKNSEARSEVIEFGKGPDGQPLRIGVIQLPSFYMDMEGARLDLTSYKSTTKDVRRLLDEFNKQDVDVVVMDLRWNGGGSLTEAVSLTGLFVDRGPIVQVKGPDGRPIAYDDPEPGMAWAGPLVVVTNKFSASASEIFAGAIQDFGRGIIIGDKATHGKGTVQQLFDLGGQLFSRRNELGALKLTIQQFYRPGGDSTQNRGVLADVELPSLTAHLDVGEMDLDYALEFDHVKPLPHDQYFMTDPSVVRDLQKQSAARVAATPFFEKEEKRIAYYEQQKDEESITLNKEKFIAEREELDADKEEEETFEQLSSPERPVFDMNDYGKELLNITVDYMRYLGGNQVAVARQSNQPVVTP